MSLEPVETFPALRRQFYSTGSDLPSEADHDGSLAGWRGLVTSVTALLELGLVLIEVVERVGTRKVLLSVSTRGISNSPREGARHHAPAGPDR
jgi:hypothetical protein